MSEKRTTRRGSTKPSWLKKRLHVSATGQQVRQTLVDLGLSTVCDQAHCPNRSECFAQGTATFLILGDSCTRSCRFCAVQSGPCEAPNPNEPQAVAEAAQRMGLHHVVITSVTRDDLPNGGAGHFAATITAVREQLAEAIIEVLTPDFQGDGTAIETVLAAGPDIFNHNVETVSRLYPAVRPQADYQRSLDVLQAAKEMSRRLQPDLYTKSGLMVGLGEEPHEVLGVLRDLREAAVDIVTIGQYLAPSGQHAPVVRYVEPETFAAWEKQARAMGFAAAACGPFVRSSYHAKEVFQNRKR